MESHRNNGGRFRRGSRGICGRRWQGRFGPRRGSFPPIGLFVDPGIIGPTPSQEPTISVKMERLAKKLNTAMDVVEDLLDQMYENRFDAISSAVLNSLRNSGQIEKPEIIDPYISLIGKRLEERKTKLEEIERRNSMILNTLFSPVNPSVDSSILPPAVSPSDFLESMKMTEEFIAASVNPRSHCLTTCKTQPLVVYASSLQIAVQTIPNTEDEVGVIKSVSERRHQKPITVLKCLKSSGETDEFVSGGVDSRVVLWKLNGEHVEFTSELSGCSGSIGSVCGCVDGDRKVIAAAWVSESSNGFQAWWTSSSGDVTHSAAIELDHEVFALCLDAIVLESLALLAVGTSKRFVELYGESGDRKAFSRLISLAGHTGSIHSIAFNDDSSRLLVASAGQDTYVRLWSIDSDSVSSSTSSANRFVFGGHEFRCSSHAVMQGHDDLVHSTTWSEDGRSLLTASSDKTCIIWKELDDLWRDDVRLRIVGGQASGFFSAVFIRDDVVVSSSYSGGLHAWKTSDDQKTFWTPLPMTGCHVGEVRDVDWQRSGDGEEESTFLMSVGQDQTTSMFAKSQKQTFAILMDRRDKFQDRLDEFMKEKTAESSGSSGKVNPTPSGSRISPATTTGITSAALSRKLKPKDRTPTAESSLPVNSIFLNGVMLDSMKSVEIREESNNPVESMKMTEEFIAASVNPRSHCLTTCKTQPLVVYASSLQIAVQTIPNTEDEVGVIKSVSERRHQKPITVLKCLKSSGETDEFVSGGVDSRVVLWKLNGEHVEFTSELSGCSGSIGSVCGCVDDDRKVVAAAWVSESSNGFQAWWTSSSGDVTHSAAIELDHKVSALCLDAIILESLALLAVGTSKRFVELYGESGDRKAFSRLISLAGHTGSIHSIAFNDDSSRLLVASAGQDTYVRLWSIDSDSEDVEELTSSANRFVFGGHEFRCSSHAVMQGHDNWVHSTTWSEDGRSLLTASSDKTCIIWKELDDLWRDDVRLRIVGGQASGFFSAVFIRDDVVVSSSYSGGLHAWKTSDDQKTFWTPLPMTACHVGEVRDVDWQRSGDGEEESTFLMSVGQDQTTRVLAKSQKQESMKMTEEFIAASVNPRSHCLTTCKTQPLVVYASSLQIAVQTIPNTEDEVGVIKSVSERRHQKPITVLKCLKSSGETDEFVSGGVDSRVVLWKLNGEHVEFTSELSGCSGSIGSVCGCVDDDRKVVAAAWVSESSNGFQAWWTSSSGDVTHSAAIELDHKVSALCLDAIILESLALLAVGTSKRFVELYGESGDRKAFSRLISLAGHTGSIHSIAFNDDSSRLLVASAGQDTYVRLWSIDSDSVSSSTSSANRFVFGGHEFRCSSHAVMQGHDNWVHSTTWSEDGRSLLTASSDKTCIVWKELDDLWRDDVRLRIVGGQASGFFSAVFIRDDVVVSSSYSGGLHAWKTSDDQKTFWTPLPMTGCHVGEVRDADWQRSGDGEEESTFLMSVGQDQTTRVLAKSQKQSDDTQSGARNNSTSWIVEKVTKQPKKGFLCKK